MTQDTFVQVPPDSTGKKIDNSQLSIAPINDPQNANTVLRQRTVISDDTAAGGLATVKTASPGPSDAGLSVRIVPNSSGTPLTQDDALSSIVALLQQLIAMQPLPSLTNLPPSSVLAEGNLMVVGGMLVQPKFAIANIGASTTDGSIVPVSGGKKIRVLSYRILAGATATNFTFNSKPASSAGAAVSELYACGVNGGISVPYSPVGHFETKVGEGLTGTTGAGSTVGVGVVYVEVMPIAPPPLS